MLATAPIYFPALIVLHKGKDESKEASLQELGTSFCSVLQDDIIENNGIVIFTLAEDVRNGRVRLESEIGQDFITLEAAFSALLDLDELSPINQNGHQNDMILQCLNNMAKLDPTKKRQTIEVINTMYKLHKEFHEEITLAFIELFMPINQETKFISNLFFTGLESRDTLIAVSMKAIDQLVSGILQRKRY